MVDRIDIGETPPTTSFRYTGATPITADQYRNSFVNYFNQHIGGSASLEEQTGIDVDTPEIAGVPISYEEKQDDDSTSVLASAFRPENIANFTFGEEAMNSFDNLKRPTIVEDRTELFDDFKDLFRNATDNGIVQTLEGAAPYAIKTIASAMNPLLGIGVSALTGGEGTNLLANEARKVQADKIDAVRAAMSRGDADAGFVMTFNRLNIVRGPGENFYTGNRQGISFKQLKNLEAVQKGFLPETFRFDRSKDGQDGFFLRGQPINQTIDGSGGIRISDNPLDGFYKADGTFYSPRFGYSKMGMMSHIAKLSATTGLSDTEILRVLSIARSGKGNFGDMIRDLTTPVRTTVDVQERKLTEKEKQNIAEQRKQVARDAFERAKDAGLDKKDKDGKNIAVEFARRAVEYERGDMSDDDIKDDIAFNTGGFVQRLAPGGGVRMADSASGFVDGVPPSQATDAQEVADDKEGKLPEGAFVINASAVTFAGETDIINMLRQAQEEAVRRGITADNPKASSMIDVAVSRGEVVVAPYLVNIIGKDRLEKINNRGVKDTERKIEKNGQQVQGAATGGPMGQVAQAPIDGYEYQEAMTSISAGVARALGVFEDVNKSIAVSKKFREMYNTEDNIEDTLRHILLGGLTASVEDDNFLTKGQRGIAKFLIDDVREKHFGDAGFNPESDIDLNNNAYGRALRRKFPDKDRFTRAAVGAALLFQEGDAFEVDGLVPQLSTVTGRE